jgi:hypothetical protein
VNIASAGRPGSPRARPGRRTPGVPAAHRFERVHGVRNRCAVGAAGGRGQTSSGLGIRPVTTYTMRRATATA